MESEKNTYFFNCFVTLPFFLLTLKNVPEYRNCYNRGGNNKHNFNNCIINTLEMSNVTNLYF